MYPDKIIASQHPRIGSYNTRLVAIIDCTKILQSASWWKDYFPMNYFPCAVIKGDQKEDLNSQYIDFIKCEQLEIYIPLEDDNKNWYEENKEAQDKIFPAHMRKSYSLSSVVKKESFLVWYMHSRQYLNDDWIKDNEEVISYWDSLVTKEYQKLVDASEIGYMIGLKRCADWNMDFNIDNGIILKNLIAKNNKSAIKVVLEAGAVPTEDMLVMTSDIVIKSMLKSRTCM